MSYTCSFYQDTTLRTNNYTTLFSHSYTLGLLLLEMLMQYLVRSSMTWETPIPSHSPRLPPRSAKKVVQLKVGYSDVCITTSGSKEKAKVVVSPSVGFSDSFVPTTFVDKPQANEIIIILTRWRRILLLTGFVTIGFF